MGRPPLAVGTYGNISTRENEGMWTAYARYRDSDGTVRAATRTDTSKTRAVDKLKIALRDRTHQAGSDDISASTKIAALVDLWMASKPGQGEFSAGTLGTYEDVIRTVIKPGIGELRIGELTVGRLDRWMSDEHQKRPGRAKTARTVVKQALDLAARRDALAVNPMLAVSKPMKKTSNPRAVNEDELTRLRSAFEGQRQPGPLADISETMLGLGLRIGEALALTVDDLDLDNPDSPRVRIAATVSQPAGGTLFRQPYPKPGPNSGRFGIPPDWVEEVLRRRAQSAGPSGLLFATRNDTLLSPSNVRRTLRNVRTKAGLEWMSSHNFRKTTATTVERSYGLEVARQIMDHDDSRITKEFYIETRKKELPDVRGALESLRPGGMRPPVVSQGETAE